MIKLGLLGGMSYQSTTHYYQGINDNVNNALGENNCANIAMISKNFQELVHYMDNGEWEKARLFLLESANELKALNVDKMIIATNTMHKFADDVEQETGIEVLHISDAIADKIKKSKIQRIGLIGTKPTMTEDFIKDRLVKNNLEVFTPQDAKILTEIHRIIFKELCNGVIKDESREYYKEVISQLVDEYGIDGIILGCTEIEMLIKQKDSPIPTFDTAQTHIDYVSDIVIKSYKKGIR